MNKKIKDIARLSLVAAMYIVLTVINPLSFGAIQFRISEILMFLIFFRKDYSISLIVGCFISNLFSDIIIYDIIFGTTATILACICIAYSKNIIFPIIFASLFNSVLVGYEIYLAYETPFIINALYVFIGEFMVMVIGCLIFNKLKNNVQFMELIQANQNLTKKEND